MDTLALKLPGHLYTASSDPDSPEHEVILDAERVVAWYDHGRGVRKLCKEIYDSDLHTIGAWEEDQSLLLDEQWLSLENGEDDDENEAQYNLACVALASEASDKRNAAHTRRMARETAIERLVQQSMAHIETHRPAVSADNSGNYLFLLVAISVLAVVLFI